MAQVNSNILGNALQTKINPQPLMPVTSTPQRNSSPGVAFTLVRGTENAIGSGLRGAGILPPTASASQYTAPAPKTNFGPTAPVSSPQTKPVTSNNGNTGAITPTQAQSQQPQPSYDTRTGQLTDYGKSIGARDVNALPKQVTSPQQTQQPQQTNTGLYSKYVQQLANQGTSPYNQVAGTAIDNLTRTTAGNQTLGQNAQDIANAAGQKISDIGQQGARGAAGYLSTGTSPVGEGNAAILNQSTAAQQQAVAQGANMQLQGNAQALTAQNQAQSGYNQAGGLAFTGQGQAQTGLNDAAGYAGIQQLPYNAQNIDPITRLPINGGGSGALPPDAQQAISTYAAQVKAGTMTRSDAEQRLAPYGIAGTNALTQALGGDFNTNASNASAGTTATGQQIKTAADSTNRALDSLSSTFSSLSTAQTGGIPLTNSIANWIGDKFGQTALSQYKTNLADARSQLIGVLNSSGGTPTGNEATAKQYLPDDMTKSQFDANVGTVDKPGIVRQLIQQKVSSFTQSGQQGGSSSGTSGNGIYNF